MIGRPLVLCGVSKHGGPRKPIGGRPSFGTAASPPLRTGSSGARTPGSPMSRWPWPYSRCQTAQSSSFPRRVVAPGFSSFPFASIPEGGVGGAPTGALFRCRVCETRRSALVRRGASHDAGRSPLGAPPWRFSAGGRASISGIASGSVQRCSSQPGRHAWRAVSRTSRARGYEPRPQDATPRSAFQDRLRKTPLHERGWESLYYKFVT